MEIVLVRVASQFGVAHAFRSNVMSTLRRCLFLAMALCLTSPAWAVIIANDNASSLPYDDGWQDGDNGGFGFGAWDFFPDTPVAGTEAFVISSTTNGASPSGHINTTIGPDLNVTAPRSWGLFASNSLS